MAELTSELVDAMPPNGMHRAVRRTDLYTRLAGQAPRFDGARLGETITLTPETVDDDRGTLEAGMTGLPIA